MQVSFISSSVLRRQATVDNGRPPLCSTGWSNTKQAPSEGWLKKRLARDMFVKKPWNLYISGATNLMRIGCGSCGQLFHQCRTSRTKWVLMVGSSKTR
ncbi:hypothetical protein L596_016305 [Steinernema carpocapsae]|uniref:Uncharacterized protein n=1 Tax=Steinernema carpocapsae TaxID=34508 RepID=A0A4U5NIS7_STECR|nr:hypothetical protein L596_016305 [Steinernema carpocapsae]